MKMKQTLFNNQYLYFGMFIALVLGFITSCGSYEPVSDDTIIAEWKDSAWTVADFKDKMLIRHRNEATAEKQPYSNRLDILTEYVVRELKIREGRRLAYDKRIPVQKAYNEALERAAVDLLYKHKVRERFITPEMLRNYYEHDRWEVRARHILIAMDTEVTGKDTLSYWRRANDVLERARKGEDFAMLVDMYSEDSSIDRRFRGDLGYFRWGRMVDEFQEAAWALNKGEISNIVRSRYGYHIIQLLDKRPNGLQVRTSQILVSVTRRADPAETTAAWERARMILEEVRKPGADFAQLARRYSEDKSSWINGDLGWLPRGSMPSEYWDVALGMEIGQIAGPVRTYQGYHIIKATDTRVDWKPFEDPEMQELMYSRIESMYRNELRDVAEAFTDSIMKAHNMRYNDKVMNLVAKKITTPDLPGNMNPFALLSPDERAMLIVEDDLGGLAVDTLVQLYGDHRFPPRLEDQTPKEMLTDMIKPLLVPRYLLATAIQEGYMNNPNVIREGRRALDNAILPEIERDMVYNMATPVEIDVEKYYKDNINKYKIAATATVYEVMVDNKQLAEEILDRIKKGENISSLARRYTMRERAKRTGGRLGPFTIDQYGAVSQAAFKLQIGEISKVIPMSNTYSIVQLLEKTNETVKPLEEVRADIEYEIRFNRQRDIQNAWVAELRRYYGLKIHEDVLKRVWPLQEQLPEVMVAERDKWKEERRLFAEQARRKAEEDRIRLRLQPDSEQTFIRGDKEIKVKIGEPRYVDKEGQEVQAPEGGGLKVTPRGRTSTQTQGQSPSSTEPGKQSPIKIERVSPQDK